MAAKRKNRRRKNKAAAQKKLDFSKRLIADIRWLLWAVTIGGLVLAAYCIKRGYTGSLPWLATMVGLPWAAHGTVCSFYLNMAKSDHREGGITYDTAKANNFGAEVPATGTPDTGSTDSPSI